MYLEQIVIDDYLIAKSDYDSLSEEQKWEHEEPIPPDAFLRDEAFLYDEERDALPDIMGSLGID